MHAVTQVNQQPLRRFAADARNAGECGGVLCLDTALKTVDGNARENADRNAWAHARYFQEAAKQAPLGLGSESIERMRVLAYHLMGEERDLGTDARQTVVGRHRCLELIANTAHVDDEERWLLHGDPATQKPDHRPTRRFWA